MKAHNGVLGNIGLEQHCKCSVEGTNMLLSYVVQMRDRR